MRRRPLARIVVDGLVMLVAAGLVIAMFRSFLPHEIDNALVKVVDGDSLRQGDRDIRLFGIDAPELQQSCLDSGGSEYPCGQEAKAFLQHLVSGNPVTCNAVDTDRYQRLVALCKTEKIMLNSEMVKQGWAVAYSRHDPRFGRFETEARQARRGIWQGQFQPPAEYRAQHPQIFKGDMMGGDE
jgi:endonuclease YncB( thermonuclease family)